MFLQASENSKYANVPEVVLGYRYERDSLEKKIRIRKNVIRVIMAYKKAGLRLRMVAVLSHIVRALIDIAVYKTGVIDSIEASRYQKPDKQFQGKWEALVKQVSKKCDKEGTK